MLGTLFAPPVGIARIAPALALVAAASAQAPDESGADIVPADDGGAGSSAPVRRGCPPWGEHRFVDPTGHYVVVMKEETGRRWWDQRAWFALVRAAEGRIYQNSTWHAEGYTGLARSLPVQLPGDTVLAQGHLPPGVGLPGTVLVSSSGFGFAAIGGWCDWHTHSNDVALTVVEATGEVTIQLRLSDLFTDPELRALPFVHGPRAWLDGAWMDEEAEVVVLVAVTGPTTRAVRLVDRATGQLREDDPEILWAALDHPEPSARAAAVNVLGARRAFVGQRRQRLPELLHDRDPSVRLRAAIVLDREQDERGFVHLKSVALDPTARLFDRRQAVEMLLRGHLDEAIPIVRPLLPSQETDDESVIASGIRVGGEWSAFVMSVLEDIGDEAIPRVVDVVLDESLLYGYRQQAVDALARLGTESAITMLTTLAAFDDLRIAARATRLLIERAEGDRSIPGRLCDLLLADRTHSEATIVRFFTNRRYAAAIGPLEHALARLKASEEPQPLDDELADLIEVALAYQRSSE